MGWLLKKLFFIILGLLTIRYGVPAIIWLLAVVGTHAHSLALLLGVPGVSESASDDLSKNALMGFVAIAGSMLALLALTLLCHVLEGLGRFALDAFIGLVIWCWKLPGRAWKRVCRAQGRIRQFFVGR